MQAPLPPFPQPKRIGGMRTIKTLAALAVLFALAPCGVRAQDKTAYYGTWRHTNYLGHWFQYTVSADTLVMLDYEDNGIIMSDLTWTPMDDPGGSTYPKGYMITGHVDHAVNCYVPSTDGKGRAVEEGEYGLCVLYIHTDGQSLAEGSWSPSYSATTSPFVKQPDAHATENEKTTAK